MQSANYQTFLSNLWADAWSPPAQLNPWQWAEAELEFSGRSTPFPGRFRSNITPFIRKPLEAFADPKIRRLTLCWSAQSAKSTALLIMLVYAVSQDPGPALVVQSSENSARSFSKNRLQPLIRDCPALSKHMTGKKHDFNSLEMFLDKMTIYLQGAGSPAQLAMRPVRFLFADEVGKWPNETKEEADALNLALERTKSYRNCKQVLTSTPNLEKGNIWQSYLSGTQERFYVPCPYCGSHFVFEWPQMRWPESTDKEAIKAGTSFECPHCKAEITEKDRPGMLQNGKWIQENQEAVSEHRSFHLNELYSPISRWGDLVLKFLQARAEAKTGVFGSLHNFINSSLAEPWREDEHRDTRPPEDLLQLCDEQRKAGQVPDKGILALTAGIDTQDNGFWFVIRAWGEDLESWLIREGFAPDIETLKTVILDISFQDSEGNQYVVNQVLIDSGGHRTDEIYQLCRENPKMKPIKGEQRLYGQSWKVSVLDKVDRKGRSIPIPGGLQLIRIDTNHYKDLLAGKLSLPEGSKGAFHLHQGVSGDYLSHMTSEYKDEKGIWRKPSHKRCDLWDCEVYSLTAADIIGVRFWQSPEKKKSNVQQKTTSRQGKKPPWSETRPRPSWFYQR